MLASYVKLAQENQGRRQITECSTAICSTFYAFALICQQAILIFLMLALGLLKPALIFSSFD
jgi:hypothetical protein